MEKSDMRHEIVLSNPDVDVRFYLSEDEGSFVTPHWHNSLEIVYVIEGKVTVNLPYGNRETACGGEFFIVNPRTIHSILSVKNRALVLQIPQKLYNKYVSFFENLYFSVSMQPKNEVERTRLDKLKKIFMDMYIVYDIRPEGYLLKFYSLLYDLMYTLIHSYSEKMLKKNIEKSEKYFNRIRNIMQYIDENHNRNITAAEIAEKFCYNADYLNRFFKKYMNCSITDYIYTVRLNYVHREIINTDFNIGDIFEKHGCTNYRVASRMFKERWGCTPYQKRKAFRENNKEKGKQQ